jgi:hypothetical protein
VSDVSDPTSGVRERSIAEGRREGDRYARATFTRDQKAQMPDGRRDFLKQLAAVAGGIRAMPERLRTGAEVEHAILAVR